MDTAKLNFIEKWIKPYQKSIMAFVIPFAGNLLAAGQDGSHGGSAITSHEWLESLLLAVVSAGAVWGVSNTSREETMKTKYQPEQVASGDDT